MRYRIHRMKETPREHFRWAAHTGGLATVKTKDYEVSSELEAPSIYAAWKSLESGGMPLRIGDLAETLDGHGGSGQLYIFKYIGFESAQWLVPEVAPQVETPELVDNWGDRSSGSRSIYNKSS